MTTMHPTSPAVLTALPGADPSTTRLMAQLPPSQATALTPQGGRDTESAAAATAQTLSRLASQSPDALSLHLATLASHRQQQLATLTAGAASTLSATSRTSSAVQNFEKLLVDTNRKTVGRQNEFLSKFAAYITALNELMVAINALPHAGSDGKMILEAGSVLARIQEFGKTWVADDKSKLATFDSPEEAQAFASRFRGGTVLVNGNTLWLNFRVLGPVLDAIAYDSGCAEVLKRSLTYEGIVSISSTGTNRLRTGEVTSNVAQALTLATGDIQKSAQTDMDLQITEFSRTISQYDNLMKLYSSLMAAMTDTCKSFL